MTNRFDWQTDEDDKWTDVQAVRKLRSGRRRWTWLAAIVGALVLAAGAVFWQVRERISAAESARANDILSSYYLIQQAIDEDDSELFRNLLSGRDAEWATAQQELFARGWLYDLSAFGLINRQIGLDDAEVVLSPELDSGEVLAESTYGLRGQGLERESIRLQQTSIFRRGERWVWSPPRDDFWGRNSLTAGQIVAVSYPDRDEQVALRLQRDLDGIVTKLCSEVDELSCPAGLEIQLALSQNPATLFEVSERFASLGLYGTQLDGRLDGRLNGSGRLEVTMPTPSLIGIPVDESGYQALLRGYATHLVIGLGDRLIDVNCCGTEARYRAALQVMLSDLGLLRWPADMGEIEVAIDERPAESQVPLLCSGGFERSQRMFLIDLDEGEWQAAPMDLEALSIKGIPDGEGVLVLGQSTEEGRTRSQVWAVTPNGERLVFEERTGQAEAAGASWELQERSQRLVISIPDQRFNRYVTINLRECLQSGCQVPERSMASRPVWSPNGDRLLVREYGLLWRRQGFSSVPVGDGTAAFWLNEQTFGFVRSADGQQAVVVMNFDGNGEEQVLLTTDDLLDAFDIDQLPPRLLIGRVLVSPDETAPWRILVFDLDRRGGMGQARFVAYEPETGQTMLVPRQGRLLSFNISPSGQWLATAGYDDDEGQWVMTVTDQHLTTTVEHRLATGGSTGAVPSYSWSADEEWLLILEQGLLTLINPTTGAHQRVLPPVPGCIQAAWYGATRPDSGKESQRSTIR